MNAFQRVDRGYGRPLHGFGLISSFATLIMMLLVVANVIGRYLFNKAATGTLSGPWFQCPKNSCCARP